MQEKHKQCFKCGETKPLSAFYKHSKMADGYLNKCKECNKKDVILNRLDKVDYYNEYDRKRSLAGTERAEKQKVRSKELRLERNKDSQPKVKPKMDGTWNSRNPEKVAANRLVNNYLRDGKIRKPCNCSVCGKTNCEIQGHHWSYLEEHWLDVIWLCIECHNKEHRKINAENRQKLLQSESSTT